MKFKKILAAVTAATLMLSLSGCMSLEEFLYYGSSESEEVSEISEIDDSSESSENQERLDSIKADAEKLIEYSKKKGNSEQIEEYTQKLIDCCNEISEELAFATVDYYSDLQDEDTERIYDDLYKDYYVAFDYLCYAFANAYNEGNYDDLLEKYTDDDSVEYYTTKGLTLKRIEAMSRLEFEKKDELLDGYFDVAYDEDIDDDEKNLEAAKLYLELLEDFETDNFYNAYNRDFDGKSIFSLSDIITEKIADAAYEVDQLIYSMPELDEFIKDPIKIDDPIAMIDEYAPNLSDAIGASAKKLKDDELYVLKSGKKCYNGSFCIDLPATDRALLYVYCENDFYDLLTAVHEFGHFHASYYDSTPDYLAVNNVDIAEIQSQGMEIVFMENYDDIFGKYSDLMKLSKIDDMLYAVLSGFLIGQFEYDILSRRDKLKPEDVVEHFDALMKKGGYDLQFYEISHLFEQPGYYISYCVSALAALNIWMVSLDDQEKALEMYESIAGIKCNSPESHFRAALESCGFDDVLTEKYIEKLYKKVSEYILQYD